AHPDLRARMCRRGLGVGASGGLPARLSGSGRGAPVGELCSLTLQRDDLSIPNLIASGLFGDGVAAVVLAGGRHRRGSNGGPRVVASRSVFYRDTERVMGWDVTSN